MLLGIPVDALSTSTPQEALALCRQGLPSSGLERIEHLERDTETLAAAAECHRIAGNTELGRKLLSQARALAESDGDYASALMYYETIARHALSSSDSERAFPVIDDALAFATEYKMDNRLADLQLLRGDAFSARGDFEEASAAYRQALANCQDSRSNRVAVDALLGEAEALLHLQRSNAAKTRLDETYEAISTIEFQVWSASRRVRLGQLYLRHDEQLGATSHRRRALDLFEQANHLAREGKELRTQSSAIGHIASIADAAGHSERSLGYARAAADLAEASGATDLIWRWQWQAARSLAELGQPTAALNAYEQAIDSVERVRPYLSSSRAANFEREIAPVYLETADLLLQVYDRTQDAAERDRMLRQVRATIERYKVAEIRDYFDDECVVDEERELDIERLADDVAVIYPIIFDERLEVLTSFDGKVVRHTALVSRRELSRTALAFRRGLTRRPTQRYRQPGEQLYTWLLEPVVMRLKSAGVSTLVFVADGPLRTFPLAALSSDSGYLIEDFAISNSIGLSLTSPKSLAQQDIRVLAGGMTVPIAGFSALPAVERELDSISELYAATQFRNEKFLVSPVEQELASGDFSVVHIATHGQFKANYRDSFLLAFDGRVTMDALEQSVGLRRYLNEPLELLMLSACETAVGDDRAALGLAGVALKAGARSAIATLWSINDDASAELVRNFYSTLRSGEFTKAETLRNAQLALLKDERFRHPFYWSPFLLIGNWL